MFWHRPYLILEFDQCYSKATLLMYHHIKQLHIFVHKYNLEKKIISTRKKNQRRLHNGKFTIWTEQTTPENTGL